MIKSLLTTEILKDFGAPDAKRNVLLSCAIFKMAHSYRFFGKYENNIINLITHLPTFTKLVLYVDMTTEYLVHHSKIASNPYIRIVKYNVPSFHIQLDGKKFHDGAFGVIMRFLPCFEPFPSGIQYVWSTDIDMDCNTFNTGVIKALDEYNADILVGMVPCNSVPWSIYSRLFVGGKLLTKRQFPLTLLNEFITNLDNGTYTEIITQTNKYTNLHRKITGNSRSPLGIDELFLNGIFRHYVLMYSMKVLIHDFLGCGNILMKLIVSSNLSPEFIENAKIKIKQVFYNFEWDAIQNMNKITKLRIKEYIDLVYDLRKYVTFPKCFNDYINSWPKDIVEAIFTNNSKMNFPGIVRLIPSNELMLLKDAPKSVRTNAPKSVRTNAPKSIRTNAPKSVRTNAPKSVRTNAPKSIRTNAPKSVRTNAPKSVHAT